MRGAGKERAVAERIFKLIEVREQRSREARVIKDFLFFMEGRRMRIRVKYIIFFIFRGIYAIKYLKIVPLDKYDNIIAQGILFLARKYLKIVLEV